MKQRYTLTIADMEINVISEESPEAVESLVGNVDRKIREILVSSRRCSRGEAALLCALEYCADKSKALRRVKQQEMTIYEKDAEITRLTKEVSRLDTENERLRMELDTLKESLLAAKAGKEEARLSLKAEIPTPDEPSEAPEEAPSAVEKPKTEALPEEAPAIEVPATDTPRESIEPEDVEFDPTEIFRRAKANRTIRKGQRKK